MWLGYSLLQSNKSNIYFRGNVLVIWPSPAQWFNYSSALCIWHSDPARSNSPKIEWGRKLLASVNCIWLNYVFLRLKLFVLFKQEHHYKVDWWQSLAWYKDASVGAQKRLLGRCFRRASAATSAVCCGGRNRKRRNRKASSTAALFYCGSRSRRAKLCTVFYCGSSIAAPQ